MISTEWGSPNHIKEGFNPGHIAEKLYGNSVHIFDWEQKKHLQTIDLPMPQGALPLEVRYLHEPTSENAFVGCAFGSSIFRIHPDPQNPDKQTATLVAEIPSLKVTGWALPEMPALITDILISMDDRFLYVSCWLHGDIRQYDISDPAHPKLHSRVYVGGSV
uniref:Methanethiol oxidase n=2 Tax=Caenorhabditis japonica TaxID=281687 RepID=A0A8R1IMU1_CAEJA